MKSLGKCYNVLFEITWEMLQCLSLLSHISFSFCISFLVYEWPSWPNFLIKLTDACCVWNCCPGKILCSFLWHSVTLKENHIPHTIHEEKHTFNSVCVESHQHTTSIYSKTTKRTVSHNSIMTLLGYTILYIFCTY